MTPKQYLSQIQTLDIRIRQRIEQLTELKSLTSGIRSPVMNADRVQTSPDDRMLSIVSKWVDKERQINDLVDRYVDLKDRIIGEINRLEDSRYVRILYRRYVRYESLTVIAADMGYEYKWLCRMHGEALRAFGDVIMTAPNNTIKHD